MLMVEENLGLILIFYYKSNFVIIFYYSTKFILSVD